MKIHRFYLQAELASNSEIALDGERHHYLTRVLRLKVGDDLVIFNGRGGEYTAKLTEVNRNDSMILVGAHNSDNRESPLKTSLIQAISKGERMDYAIQKSVELGVSEIQPVFTERTQVKLKGERLQQKMQHWQGVIISACEQSGRCLLPTLHQPITLQQLVEELPTPCYLAMPGAGQSLAAAVQGQAELHLLVGPEGGFSQAECDLAIEAGAQAVSLGPRILRTETAAVAMLSICQQLGGDL